MSLGFELATGGTANMMASALIEGKPVESISPAATEGFFKGAAMGVMRGGANAARALSMAGAVLPIVQDKLDDALGFIPNSTAARDRYFEGHVANFKGAGDYWTPKPHEVGAAGRIVGGLAEMLLPIGATGGNPALLIGSAQMNTSEDLIDKGVDSGIARPAGTMQALATAAGMAIPIVGKTLAQRVLFGAASNPLIGAAGAAGTAEILKSGGYEKQAEEFNAWDMEARATDVLVGMLFGGVVHMTTPKGEARTARIDPNSDLGKAIDSVTPTQRDALLTQNLAQHVEASASPGIPKSMDAKNDHVDALQKALEDLDQGKTVSAQVDPAQFDRVPQRDLFQRELDTAREAERKAIGAAYDEVLSNPRGDVNDPLVHMTPEDIGTVLLERGPNFPGKGEVEVQAGGYGLVKIIWKHGEKSGKSEALKVTREDVMRTPDVLRDFDPIEDKTQADGKRLLEWQVPRADGKDVVYSVRKFSAGDGAQHVVSIFVNERAKEPYKSKPLSETKNRSTGSPEKAPKALATQLRDTGPDSSSSPPGGQQSGSEGSLRPDGSKEQPPAPEVKEAADAVKANPNLDVTLEDGSTIKAADALAAADEIVRQAEVESKGFDAAVSCFIRGGR